MSAGIALHQVCVARGGSRVIHGVGFEIEPASWFGLIGANGSGKTSLLRAIAGRLSFDGGTCLVDGEDVTHDRLARAERFGFAPPADRLPDALRARDLLALAGGTLAAALDWLGPVRPALGIDALVDRWIGDCSAGMKQRLAIALAFAGGRRLVVLDEPFNWLDPVAAYDLRLALRERVREGLTLVTALHDLGTLATACDAGLMLADGRAALTIDAATLAQAARDPGLFERQTIDLLRSRAAG